MKLIEEFPKSLIAIKHLRNTLESPSFFLQKSTVDSKMSMLVISLNWLSPNSKMLQNKELLSVVVDLLIKCDTLSK